MYCINCGTQLPDEANFCSNCGKSPRAVEQQKESKSESCEIVWIQVQPWNWENIRKFKFVAEAIGVNGKYNVFETATIGTKDHDTKREKYGILVDEIAELLLQGGWEASETRGENWWSYRFKRNWNPEQIKWEVCDVSVMAVSGMSWKGQGRFGAFLLGKVDEKGNRKLIDASQLYKGSPQTNLSKTSSEIKDIYTSFIEHLQKDGWEQMNSTSNSKYSPILAPMTMRWDFLMEHSSQDWVRKRFRRKIKTNG